jgi:hypothetical protein
VSGAVPFAFERMGNRTNGTVLAMAWSWTSQLPPTAGAPAAARSFVEGSLHGAYRHPAAVAETCDDLVVIVSELVTNAVQAATTSLRIDLDIDGPSVRLAVTDVATGMPAVPGRAADDQPFGRGLAIVAALSREWGVVPVPGHPAGKTVWARLALPEPPDVG